MNDFYCTTTMSFDSPSISETTKLRARFFGAIDAVTTALNTRFNQEDLTKFQSIETLLLSSINKKEADNSLQQLQCFSNVIDVTKLAVELKQLPVFLDLFNADNEIPITSVTSVASICDIMNFKPSFKKCAPQVHTLLLLYNSVGFLSATAERSFSAMRRIKTWLRSTKLVRRLPVPG